MTNHLAGTGVAQPTDILARIDEFRAGEGTDDPGSLTLAMALYGILRAEGAPEREVRLVAGMFVLAIEGDDHLSSFIRHDLVDAFSEIDFKIYW